MEHPKPPKKKQKKALNNKRDNTIRECTMCHEHHVCETHEVFGGIWRQESIKYKYQLPLCGKCHDLVTKNDVRTLAMQRIWKRRCQRQRETALVESGESAGEARKIWMYEMGRNYL